MTGQPPARLLVCDDHLLFAESLAAVFTDAGHQVVAVTRYPDQARTVLRAEPVDVCVLDADTHPGNVATHLDELRAAAPAAGLVLLLAELDPALAVVALEHGARGIGHKGQRLLEILDLVARVRRGETVLDPTPRPVVPAPRRPTQRADRTGAYRLGSFLTPREREVLCRLVRGQDTRILAHDMGITAATARCHIQSVLTKLGAHSRLEAATAAVRAGLVNAETGEWLAA